MKHQMRSKKRAKHEKHHHGRHLEAPEDVHKMKEQEV